MLRIQRILFATDLSACSDRAYAHAARLALQFGAELHVVHVRRPAGASATAEDFALPLVEGVRQTIVEVESSSVSGAIAGYAEEHDVDLIVLGAVGRSYHRRSHPLGHVADEVIHRAPCPVLTVRAHEMEELLWRGVRVEERTSEDAGALVPGGHAPRPTASAALSPRPSYRVLVPVDFSEPSRLTLRYACEFAGLFGARLDLLHVLAAPATEPRRLAAKVVREYEGELRRLVSAAVGPAGPAVPHLRVGNPAAEIVAFAEESRSALIIIGTHGQTGRRQVAVGSVAEEVVRTAPCPVLTVASFGRRLFPERRSGKARALAAWKQTP